MSKIICDICGTSYPESAKQCPICGCVRPGDVQRVTNEVKSDGNVSTGYTQVKGGHFAKSNVKKRTKDVAQKPVAKKNAPPADYEPDRESRGLVIVAIVLLLAIIGVVIYIAVRFFGPLSNPNDGSQPSGNVQSGIACTDIILDTDALTFDGVGDVLLLNVTVQPKNTSDLLTYRSEDTSVVTVNSVGKVTVVGEGTTNIVITCGQVTKMCIVTVQFAEDATGNVNASDSTGDSVDAFRLNRVDITFNSKGSTWNLYDGSIARNLITWTSDDVSVATFTDGVVMAVGSGMTTVHAEYNGQKVSCTIRCEFKENGGITGNGGVTEDGGGSNTGSDVLFTGKIVTNGVNVRSGPSTSYTAVGSLNKDDSVSVYEKKSDGTHYWYRIGTDRWVREDLVQTN